MLFSSIPFLYYFLPVLLFLYLLSPYRFKNVILLLASLFFYAWGEPRYIFLMVAEIGITYVLGLLTEKYRGSTKAKITAITAVVLNLGVLGYFKYADFFISNWNAVTGMNVNLLRIALPIGISFYTFQLLSYVIDVYRGEVAAQRNPLHLATYIALFPQLIAGPIVRYSDIAKQLTARTHTVEKTERGVCRFLIGLAKKILLANAFGELCSICLAMEEVTILSSWIHATAYTLQIYFDFSGYSDMAIGLGLIFGFEFLENFNYPYISGSITEFWRRWHMSLGSWFRDYVYIPMGGNRVSRPRQLLNIATVWFLTGFWHGASWNFILWGLYFAVLLVIEKLWLLPLLKKSRIWKHFYVMLLVIIGFVLFDAVDLTSLTGRVGSLFGAGGIGFSNTAAIYYLKSFGLTFLFGIIGSTPLPKILLEKVSSTKTGSAVMTVLRPVGLTLILLVCTAYLVDSSFNPFLYFRF